MRKRLTTEEFIERAKGVHGDTYDYSNTVFVKSDEKVCITCRKHGDFLQRPFAHLRGCGCKKCDSESKSINERSSTEEFITKAREIHGSKYDYSSVKYDCCSKKVIIKCPLHGEFLQRPNDHLSGYGCPICGRERIWKKRGRISNDDFIEKAKNIHGDKYDYSSVEYKNERSKIKIICHKKFKNGVEHGVFEQTPYSHLNGNGCPNCRNSKLENKVFKLLTENKIEFEKEKTYDWLFNDGHMYLDFYLPEYNVGIECQGIQHYIDIEIRGRKNYKYIHENDLLKNKLCKENGIKIFYFTDKNMYSKYCENKELTYFDFNSMINDIKNECKT